MPEPGNEPGEWGATAVAAQSLCGSFSVHHDVSMAIDPRRTAPHRIEVKAHRFAADGAAWGSLRE